MRISACLLFILLLTSAAPAAEQNPPVPVDFQFSGYRFGQSPAANMTCISGYCKSQAVDGDGRITFPYSTYATPGAVSTLAGLMVVNPRYTFWEDRLYRVNFQVDCTPLVADECLEDIIDTLDGEYGLAPISANETRQYVAGRNIVVKEFIAESGAFIKVRVVTIKGEQFRPSVDIVDQGTANLVGTTLNPTFFKPKAVDLDSFK